MTRETSVEMDQWIAAAKSASLEEVASALGARLKRAGHEMVGPCPLCQGNDRFSINPQKRVFNCRGSGGGDVIRMVQHVNGCDFIGACEFINQTPPPRGDSRPVNESYGRERRDERRDREIAAREQESRELQKAKTNAEKLWDRGAPFEGTWAEKYLGRRGLALSEEQTENLKFIPDLEYVGYQNADSDEQVSLGRFPCMIAAIRNVAGDIIGIHRTYLDPSDPKKLVPPGDRARNAAKKVYGKTAGGAIWFGPILESVATGEGIETTLSYRALGLVGDDFSLCAAVSLGNLSGSATDSIKHPKTGKPIQNGVPDLEHPGIVFPAFVRQIVILGDGDSDPIATRMRLLTATRRFRAQGKTVSVHMAPEGADWNDALRREIGAAA